jgi:hypothetical protein
MSATHSPRGTNPALGAHPDGRLGEQESRLERRKKGQTMGTGSTSR